MDTLTSVASFGRRAVVLRPPLHRRLSSMGPRLLLGSLLLVVLGLGSGTPALTVDSTGSASRSHQSGPTPVRSALVSPTADSPPIARSLDTLRAVSARVSEYTNETREERGLSPLMGDPALEIVGCEHTADMFRRNFFRHENPDGERPQDRVARVHRQLIGGVSENLYEQSGRRGGARALARRVVDHWMNSPPHRANLLSPHPTHIGVCTLVRADTIRITQVFAKVVAYVDPELPDTIDAGAIIPVSFRTPESVDASVAKYDVWSPTRQRAITDASVVTDSLSIPDTVGTFRLRFYVVESGQYVMYPGPTVTISNRSTG